LEDQTKDYIGGVVKWFEKNGSFSHNSVNGGYVSKSGMVSVSEGELIIPSYLNHFIKEKLINLLKEQKNL
jgi:hypothetical protein